MNFTFGLITNSGADDNINLIIDSIERQNIPDYEIIIVGDYSGARDNLTVIQFDETIKPSWITRKKNIITENAKHDNIVYCHDYIKLCDGFYDGWKQFGNDWDIAMNVIKNTDGGRFRDWLVWDDPSYGNGRYISEPWCKEPLFFEGRAALAPYSYNKTEYMYISGAYWVAKKRVMQHEPLNEEIVWGQGEDLEWSKRVLPRYKYVMNESCAVQLLRHKDVVFPDMVS